MNDMLEALYYRLYKNSLLSQNFSKIGIVYKFFGIYMIVPLLSDSFLDSYLQFSCQFLQGGN